MCKLWLILQELVSCIDVNIVGLISGFVGSVLIILYGLPSLAVLNSGSYVESEITPEIRKSNRISRIGLILVSFGFLMQLLAAI